MREHRMSTNNQYPDTERLLVEYDVRFDNLAEIKHIFFDPKTTRNTRVFEMYRCRNLDHRKKCQNQESDLPLGN